MCLDNDVMENDWLSIRLRLMET